MKKSNQLRLVLLLSALICSSADLFQALGQSGPKNLPISVTHPDWKDRRVSFGQLIGVPDYGDVGVRHSASILDETLKKDPATADFRKRTLIELLRIENEFVESKNRKQFATGTFIQLPSEDRLTEAYGNYYGDVIAAVASLNDVRSLSSLIGAVSTGNMATNAIAKFGEVAVAPLSKENGHYDPIVRSSIARTLTQILAGLPKSATSRGSIKSALMKTASDKDPMVRRSAMEGLVRLGDAEARAVVERLAQTDPYRANFLNGRYLVREAAREALMTISGAKEK